MNTDIEKRRDFWNLDLNPITMQKAVHESMADFKPVYQNLGAEYNHNIFS